MAQTRRRFVALVAAAAAVPIAGCAGGDGERGDAGTDGGSDGGEGPAYVDYLADTDGFDGAPVDATGETTVTVEVGAEGNEGTNAFAPPAIRVDAGTTVEWVWTGQGTHDVQPEDGDWGADLTGEEGVTYERSFDAPGVHRYYCTPHKALGMKGVVEVVG